MDVDVEIRLRVIVEIDLSRLSCKLLSVTGVSGQEGGKESGRNQTEEKVLTVVGEDVEMMSETYLDTRRRRGSRRTSTPGKKQPA